MSGKIRDAFEGIRAEENLKSETKAFIAEKTGGYGSSRAVRGPRSYRRAITLAACFLIVFLGFGGYSAYFTETAAISIDVNPSIELGVNRFDRVVSVDGLNEDGKELASQLDIKYMYYEDAINAVLASDIMTGYLSSEESVSIVVTGSDDSQTSEILSCAQQCAAGHGNVHCYSGTWEDVEAAHEAGLSVGKYRAFLELQALDPSITAEDVHHMTMREIQDLIDSLTESSGQDSPQNGGSGSQNGGGSGAQNGTGTHGGHGSGHSE